MGDAQSDKLADAQADNGAMMRAIDLARHAAGRTAPNPMVGCVLVKDGRIIAEGWHEGPGKDHAEVMALKNASEEARGSTAFVSLEPCNHTGRTGPCSKALIAAGIREVVCAMADPNPVAAGGANRLRAADIPVRVGICETEARHLNRAWLHAISAARPFVTAKSAMSLDGRIATHTGESQWITSHESRKAGHRIRANVDAILVGAQTVLADDPSLTARIGAETRRPLRVVLDSTARTSPGAKIYERVGRGALLATTGRATARRLDPFREMGVEVLQLPAEENGRVDLDALLSELFARNVHHLMVEGGGEVLGAFFDADLIDEIELFVAPKLIGGGSPAFGGKGVAHLADADRFDFRLTASDGPDQHWTGMRKETA